MKNTNIKGFTLLELMAVVAIIGILAAVAVPSFLKYIKKSKNTEAYTNLRKIYDGEVLYYQEDHTLASGVLTSKTFVSFDPLPVSVGVNKQTVNFTSYGWDIIKFSTDAPVLYSYAVETSGINTSASFTARAVGDVDADGTTSLFERVGAVDSSGNIAGGAAIYTVDPTE